MQRVTSLGSASSASAGTDAGEGEAIGASSEEEGGAAPPGASRRGLSIGGGLEAAPNAGRASPAATRPSARSGRADRLVSCHFFSCAQRAERCGAAAENAARVASCWRRTRASLAAHRQHVVGRVVALAVVRRLARVPARRLRAARRRARPRRRPRAARRRPPRRTDYHDRSTPGATSASGGRRAPPPPRFRSATLPNWPHAAILSAPRVSRSLTK